VNKFGNNFGEPEDYEIWNEHSPGLSGPLVNGLSYEIVSRITPGRPKPQERRNSFDAGLPPAPRPAITFDPKASLPPRNTRHLEWSPPAAMRTEAPAREVPPTMESSGDLSST
jgi:hypothetical protein